METQRANAGRAGTEGEHAVFSAETAAKVEGEPGAPTSDSGFGADDPEMVELRAFAAEVTGTGAGTPRRSGYRPRLETSGRGQVVAPAARLSTLASEMVSSVRLRPRRTLAFALTGVAAVAGALWLVRAVAPSDEPLELAIAPPPSPRPAAAPAPLPPIDEPHAAAPRVARAPKVDQAIATASRRKERKESKERKERKELAPAGGRARRTKAAATQALDRGAIIQGMQAIQPRVKACYRRYKQRGVANTSIDVGPGGNVAHVTVTGPLARTRTGVCVKAAVKTARFRGGGMTFQYPLVLP